MAALGAGMQVRIGVGMSMGRRRVVQALVVMGTLGLVSVPVAVGVAVRVAVGVGMAVHGPVGMGVLMPVLVNMLVGMLMGVGMFLVVALDPGLALAAAAGRAHD